MITGDQISYPSVKQAWGIVGIAFATMIVLTPVNLLLNKIAGREISFLLYYVLSMGSTFWFAHVNSKRPQNISAYHLGFSSVKMMILISFTILAIQIGIVSPLASIIPMPDVIKKVFVEFSKRTGFFSFVAIVVAAPILEELVFRGIILDGFLKRYSPLKSILISSALFGVIHLNPWQFIGAMLGGCFSGWIYYKTRKLTLSILIHMVNNLVAFSSMYFIDAEKYMDMSLTEFYGGFSNLLLVTIGAQIIAIICLYFLQQEFRNTNSISESTASSDL